VRARLAGVVAYVERRRVTFVGGRVPLLILRGVAETATLPPLVLTESTAGPCVGWQILAQLTACSLDGPGQGFYIGALAGRHDVERQREWLAQVEAAEPVVTGRLRSLTHAYIDEEYGKVNQRRNFIRGRVRILRTKEHNTAAAGGALEYGAHRRFPVQAYTRRRRGGGSVMQARKSGKLYRSFRIKVSAYNRRAHITAMRFLRGPALRQQPRARAEINAVLEDAMKEFR